MNLHRSTLLVVLLLPFAAACDGDSGAVVDAMLPDGAGVDAATTTPTVVSNIPIDDTIDVSLNAAASVKFSEAMDPATLNVATFSLTSGSPALPVQGSILYDDSVAFFWPNAIFASNTLYTATITTDAMSAMGIPLTEDHSWSFTSGTTLDYTPTLDLASAGDFVILAKSAISNVGVSNITGDVGISPETAAAVTGFVPPLTLDLSLEFSTTTEITGRVYAANYEVPTPAKMTAAVSDMEAAYNAAEARASDVTAAGEIDIGGTSFGHGVYKWTGAVEISSDVTLIGSATDVWIFQVAGALTLKDSAKIVLAGGALSKNVFWQTSGAVLINTGSHCEGSILTKTAVTMITGASSNGRILAQTAVTLGANTVTEPAP